MYFDTVQMAQRNSCEMQALGRAITVWKPAVSVAVSVSVSIYNLSREVPLIFKNMSRLFSTKPTELKCYGKSLDNFLNYVVKIPDNII